MSDYLDKEVRKLIEKGYEKFYIYPFGKIGMQIKELLVERYGIDDYVLIDNSLCRLNKNVIECKELDGKQWNEKEIVIVASNSSEFYTSVRLEIKKYVPREKINDLFSISPLVYDKNPRISSLAAAAREIYRNNIEGSVAECGVYQGDFAKYINMVFPDRSLYLFDSFEGFDSQTVVGNCDNFAQTDKWINTLKDTSEDIVMKKMKFPENIIVKKGFIPETLENIRDKFCFVNLDMDLYSPTYEGLNFFWDNLSKGGYIFVHDFYVWDGIEVAIKQFCTERNIGYVCSTDACSVIIVKPI